MASSVDYIISRMSRPFCKVLSLCTGIQNAKNINMKCFPSVKFTSLALEKTINLQTSELNSASLRKQNHDWIYQVTIGDDADVCFSSFNPHVARATYNFQVKYLSLPES